MNFNFCLLKVYFSHNSLMKILSYNLVVLYFLHKRPKWVSYKWRVYGIEGLSITRVCW